MEDDKGNGEKISELLDALENATTIKGEVGAAREAALDAIEVAWAGLLLAFYSFAVDNRKEARAVKDTIAERLKRGVSNRQVVDYIVKALTDLCDVVER